MRCEHFESSLCFILPIKKNKNLPIMCHLCIHFGEKSVACIYDRCFYEAEWGCQSDCDGCGEKLTGDTSE